jgi:pescadillo
LLKILCDYLKVGINCRYPTFVDAVRDIDDALCMIFLFASLPSDGRVSPALVENCARLAAEWQLYIMHTHSLRKCFLSIKGVYYQAEVVDQTVTWLVPYSFTQYVRLVLVVVDLSIIYTYLQNSL